ncbi:hypothetical protein ACJZ2D_004137 [Fusarium nematophilum]
MAPYSVSRTATATATEFLALTTPYQQPRRAASTLVPLCVLVDGTRIDCVKLLAQGLHQPFAAIGPVILIPYPIFSRLEINEGISSSGYKYVNKNDYEIATSASTITHQCGRRVQDIDDQVETATTTE